MKSLYSLAMAACIFTSAAWADEAAIKSAMEKRFPYENLISVTKTPFAGLYEVVFEDQLVYTDEKMEYLFSGNVIDMRTMENLTAARSRIMDADFAAETAAMTKASIAQQAGVAMLAQANALPQQVLSLLRG